MIGGTLLKHLVPKVKSMTPNINSERILYSLNNL